MERRINYLIIMLALLTAGNQVFAQDVATEKSVPSKKSIKTIFAKKQDEKISENKKESDIDTVFTPEASKRAEVKKEKKYSFKIFTRKTDNKSEIQSSQLPSENDLKESKTSDKNKVKLQRVKETKSGLNSNSSSEIKIMSDKDVAKKVEGSVASNRIISIDDCIKLALENHPAIRSSMSSTEIYKSKIAQAWSAYFPKFGLDANYSRNDMLIGNFAFPNQKYGMYSMPKVSADMLLFDFGKTKSAADISTKAYEASQNTLQMSINEVIYNVKSSYFNLLFAIQQQEVLEKTVKNYETHLKQAQAYYNIGTKAKIDVMTAEYNLGKAKLDCIKSKNNVALAYAQVSAALGIPEFSNYTIADKLESQVYKIGFDEILQTAYETRPELLAAKKKVEGSEVLIKASVRAFAPDVVAFGNYTLGGTSPNKDHGYQLGAGLTYRSTNLFLLKKQVDEAKATYKRDLADYEYQKQKVYLEVKQAYIQLYNAQDSIPVAKLSMKRAKEQYDLASGRYKVGMGDAIELKDAETTYRNAQLDYYNTLLNYNVAAANIERVIGSPIKASEQSLI